MESKLSVSLDDIECVFLDLDGTIYLGGELISGAIDFLKRLKNKNIEYFFLSNNSSKSVDQYLEKLNSLEILTYAGEGLTEPGQLGIDHGFDVRVKNVDNLRGFSIV